MAAIKQILPFWFNFSCINTADAILDLINDSLSEIRLMNHILLLCKFYIYKSGNKHWLNINELLVNILKVKKLEKLTAFVNVEK